MFCSIYYSFVALASSGAPIRGRDHLYGSGVGLITLDNVVCTGEETDLLQCDHDGVLTSNCDHNEDAAVVCGSESSSSLYFCSLCIDNFICCSYLC